MRDSEPKRRREYTHDTNTLEWKLIQVTKKMVGLPRLKIVKTHLLPDDISTFKDRKFRDNQLVGGQAGAKENLGVL